MNWLQRLAIKAFGFPQARTLSLTDPSGWPSWGEGTHAGKYVDDTTAMQVSSVWSCNRVISETVASLPGAMFERDSSGNLNRVDSHPLGEILTISPNYDQTGPEFFESKMLNQGLNGNGYSIIDRRGGGDVASLTPVEANKMRPYRKDGGPIRYKFTDRGKEEDLPQEKVWHWKTFSRDGCVGLSPIGNARETMGLAMAQQEVAGKLFANGLHTSVFINIPEWIKDDKREAVHAKLKRMYQGLTNAGEPLILEGGMKAEKGIMPFVDAQFVQLLGMGVDQICGVYRVPPHMIGKLDRATFSNIEQQSLEFVMYTILPYLRRIEHSISKWLLKPGERTRFVFRFNFEGLLRADSAARASLYSIMLQNGVLTRNEVRALENRNRLEIEGMDEPTVQQNMALIEQLSALLANKTQPQPMEPATKAAPVEIRLSSFEETVGLVAEGLKSVNEKQALLAEALKSLATSHDGVHDAMTMLAHETKRNADRVEQTNVEIKSGLSAISKPRRAVKDANGDVIGSEIVDKLH